MKIKLTKYTTGYNPNAREVSLSYRKRFCSSSLTEEESFSTLLHELNHECLHAILHSFVDRETSKTIDNILHYTNNPKNKDLFFWMELKLPSKIMVIMDRQLMRFPFIY